MQMFPGWLDGYKKLIDRRTIAFLTEKEKDLRLVNRWGPDAVGRLKRFATSGKSTRGALVLFSYRLFKKPMPKAALDAACGLELLHSGLLIHDDSIDRSASRRRYAAIHEQYKLLSNQKIGNDIALCVGDLAFFLAYELLPQNIISTTSGELAMVAVAQMQDAGVGHLDKKLSAEQIITLYTYKTARYSFSLPMRAGAVLAGCSTDISNRLSDLGEAVGILYQLRDDELDSSGNPRITGKPTGTDTKTAKQTLKSCISALELQSFIRRYQARAISLIRQLPITRVSQRQLVDLVDFVRTRTM